MIRDKKNKLVYAAISAALCCILCLTLTGCGLLSGFLENGDIVKIKIYNTSTVKPDDYGAISSSDVPMNVASIVMPATYEITCEITYSYTSGNGMFGQSTQTAGQTGQGTGFCINKEGYLVTNAHVINVEDSESLKDFRIVSRSVYANLADNDTAFECAVIAYDEALDLAVLKIELEGTDNNGGSYSIETNGFEYAAFFAHTDPTDSAKEQVEIYYGETAVAVGNANGYGIAVTVGVVSAPLRQFKESVGTVKAIQTDAAINPGNSGGPLCNSFGAVIGVNSFKIVEEKTENMSYAIPTYVVTAFLDGLADGTYTKTTVSSLGVSLTGKYAVNYFYTADRSYKSDGSNLIEKFAS